MFAPFVSLRLVCIASVCLLAVAGTGCANLTRQSNPRSQTISNSDVAQIQPAVHSSSFQMRDADTARQLAGGVYAVENGAWRWTAGDFSIVLATPPRASAQGARLVLAFNIPDAIWRLTGPLTLTAYVNGAQVGAKTYSTAGSQTFSAPVPGDSLRQSPVAVDFDFDKDVARGVLEGRELGVVADNIALETQ